MAGCFEIRREKLRECFFNEPYMFELIQRVQEAGTVDERFLPRDDDVTVSHGIARSGRRGYAIHKKNVGNVGSRTRDRVEAGPALVTNTMSHQGKTYARAARRRRKCKEKQIPASSHF
jgi:hypothetical protein